MSGSSLQALRWVVINRYEGRFDQSMEVFAIWRQLNNRFVCQSREKETEKLHK